MKTFVLVGILLAQFLFCDADLYVVQSGGTTVSSQNSPVPTDTAWSSVGLGSCSVVNPAVVSLNDTSSAVLVVVNWQLGLAISSGSTIQGVSVSITKGVSGAGSTTDEVIAIIRSATNRTQDIHLANDPDPWSSSFTQFDYAEATGITYSELTAPAFGVAIRANGTGVVTARVACITLSISFTPPTPTTGGVEITSADVTSAQLTTAVVPITSAGLTSSALTSAALTSAQITSASLTTGVAGATTASAAVTTAPLTSSPLTTSPLTSASLTTGVRSTTGRASTTGRVSTTSPVTSAPLTSAVLTTAPVTSSPVTSGEVTSSPITSGVQPATSGGATTTTGGNETSDGGKGSILAIAVAVPVAIIFIFGAVIIAILYTRKKQADYRAKKRMASSYPEVIQELGLSPPKPPTILNAVKQIGISSDQNSLYRRTMEDEHIHVDKFGGVETQFYVAVYDGHGGKLAAEKVKANLHEVVAKELKSGKSVPDAFTAAFEKVDNDIKSTGEKSGSTAAVAVIRVEDGKKKLYTANAGDARIVLKRGKQPLRMTIDHKATDPDEQKRIKDMGGLILGDKVGASLAVTRAFGDSELREWVKAEPYIKSVDLNPEDSHLIVACDGLWDVVSDQESIDQITPSLNAQEVSDKLLKLALEKGTKDNVSILVVTI